MQRNRIRRNNFDFQIHDDPSQSINLRRPSLFGAEDSSYPSVFLPVEFFIDLQH